jgi:pimeloyl-ACP methyl ester carboxylesterase
VARGRQVRFGPRGTGELGGVVLGAGRTGILLAHQTDGDLCMWTEYAATLVPAGYRVLAMDMPGYGSSYAAQDTGLAEAVVSGVALLRGQGATRVVLIGASMGGTAVLGGAVQARPPVTAVVSLSAPARFVQLDAASLVRRLTTPVLYASCDADRSFGEDAQALYAATPASTPRQLVIDACFAHGVSTLRDSAKIRAAVQAFLARYAKP